MQEKMAAQAQVREAEKEQRREEERKYSEYVEMAKKKQ